MKTLLMLMMQFDSRAIVPLEEVRQHYFSHLTEPVFRAKLGRGDIKLPVVRMDSGQKAARGIHITDLATYIDTAHAAATRELKQMAG